MLGYRDHEKLQDTWKELMEKINLGLKTYSVKTAHLNLDRKVPLVYCTADFGVRRKKKSLSSTKEEIMKCWMSFCNEMIEFGKFLVLL